MSSKAAKLGQHEGLQCLPVVQELTKLGEGFCGGKRGSPLLDEPWRRLIWLVFYHRYEEEINRRTAAENEFVVLKKVSAGDRLAEGREEAAVGQKASGGRQSLEATHRMGRSHGLECGLSCRMWTAPT